jgi:succinoglycan biosynthesis protein ExoM
VNSPTAGLNCAMNKVLSLRPRCPTEAESRTPVRVLIAIPTFRRPELLNQLLHGIAEIFRPPGCIVEALVMDNDSAPSARDLVVQAAKSFPFPLLYAHVTEPGLSSVRNFALDRARRFDFLAMIDDDEIPQRQWLVELLNVQTETAADGVIGPVPRVLPEGAPRWLRRARFFDSPVYPDRTLVRDGYSGNCLLRMESIERLHLAFDQRLNFAGGEDLLFFRELADRGGTLAYAARAVAEESVGTERATSAYILRLNFRRGNTLSLCDRHFSKRATTVATRALKAGVLIARGCIALLPYTLLRGRAGLFIALCDVSRGLGALYGVVGYTYKAYARPEHPQT